MSKPTESSRPLSPFMIGPYYRPQLTSMLSITHRATGVGLALGTLLVVCWLMAAAAGPSAYTEFSAHATAWYGQFLLICWTWALMFHLCNGIRHLFWDAGKGFELETVYATGYAVIAVSLALTAGIFILAYI